MPNLTKNFGLKKPIETEFYNVEDQNDNMDMIDGALKILTEEIESNQLGSALDDVTEKVEYIKEKVEVLDVITEEVGEIKGHTGDIKNKVGAIEKINVDVAELKTIISESVAGQLKSIFDSIGLNGDTGDSTVMGKLNRGMVKSVQRGVLKGEFLTLEPNIRIATVNPNKCLVLLNNSTLQYPSLTKPLEGSILISLNSSSLVCTLNTNHQINGSTTLASKVSWQVIEFY